MIGTVGAWFPTDIPAFGLQTVVGLNRQLVFLHEALDTIFADLVMFAVVQIGPDGTVSPKRVRFLDLPDFDQMFLVLFDAFEGAASFHSS